MTDIKSVKSKLTRNWGWVVTFASFIMNFFGLGIMYCFSITFVSLQEEFSTDSTATSWAGSIPIGLATCSGVIVTPLVGRFENRTIAVVGVFLCCISCLLTSAITDFKLIYLTYSSLYGLGIGCCSLASMDLLLRYFPRKNCSRSTLISLVGSSSGMLALGPLNYIVIENWGWRNMFRVFGTLLLVVALPATMTFSRPNAHHQACAESEEAQKAGNLDPTSRFACYKTAEGRSSKGNGERAENQEFFDNMGYIYEDERRTDRDGLKAASKTSVQENGPMTQDKEAYVGLSEKGFNRHERTTDHRSCPGVNRKLNSFSSYKELQKKQVDDARTARDPARDCYSGCPTAGRTPVDNPNKTKIGPIQLDSVTLISKDLVIHVETDEESYRQPTPNTEDDFNDAGVDESKANALPNDSTGKHDFVSFKVITISSSISYDIRNIYDVEGTDVKCDVGSPAVVQQTHSKTAESSDQLGFFQGYRAFFYPDLWLISICITGLPMMNTFYYINMGDFLISRGFERHVIPWTVTTFGISEAAGKILLAVVADRLPFPKVFIYHFACAVGIVVMGCLLVVRSVAVLLCLAVATGMIVMMVADALAYSICNQVFRPEDVVQTWTVVMVTQGLGYMLGSLFGESIDRTGSYNGAIYTSMGIYALCGLVCTAVPFYQKFFAPERFVMFENQDVCRRKRSIQQRFKPGELVKLS